MPAASSAVMAVALAALLGPWASAAGGRPAELATPAIDTAAAGITAAPSADDVEIRLSLDRRADGYTVAPCAKQCFYDAITKSTDCTPGDEQCECQPSNGDNIWIGAESCIIIACGDASATVIYLSASLQCDIVRNSEIVAGSTPPETTVVEVTTAVVAPGITTSIPGFSFTEVVPTASVVQDTSPVTTADSTAGSNSPLTATIPSFSGLPGPSPSPTLSPAPSSSALSAGAVGGIAGGAVAGVLLVGAALVLVFKCGKRNKNRDAVDRPAPVEQLPPNATRFEHVPVPGPDSKTALYQATPYGTGYIPPPGPMGPAQFSGAGVPSQAAWQGFGNPSSGMTPAAVGTYHHYPQTQGPPPAAPDQVHSGPVHSPPTAELSGQTFNGGTYELSPGVLSGQKLNGGTYELPPGVLSGQMLNAGTYELPPGM